MKKKYIVLGVVALVCAAAWIFTPSLETIVKTVVNKYGSQITGTEVKLDGFSLSLTSGEGAVKGLTVANPANYKSPYIFNLGGVKVKVNLKSLTTDTIIIEEVIVDKPVITYEMLSLTQNNLKQLQQNIAANTAGTQKVEQRDAATAEQAPTEESKAEAKAAAKKVIIKLVQINEGELQAMTSVAGQDNIVSLKLPAIKITDIGADKKGESITGSISKVLSKILSTASQAVVNTQFGDLKSVAEDNLNNVVGGVKDRIKSMGIFGK